MDVQSPTALPDGLIALSERLRDLELRLAVPGAEEAERLRHELIDQIDDYLLPRLRQMDAPLLMVVGGSTGAGKSTLVNSLVGTEVSPAGVLRPTTRSPVLACHPDDLPWFEGDRILPGMSRTTRAAAAPPPRSCGAAAGPGGLQLAPTAALPAGLALLDSPDIDSVVERNRALARQLLAAADAWLFVTTAARYADAVPWELLHAARDRGTALSLVLDRVPPEGAGEVADHLRAMVAERGLGGTPLLVVPETPLDDGLLPAAALAPVRAWLDDLAADAQARSGLVRRTLTGVLDSLPRRVAAVRDVAACSATTADGLRDDVERAYARGLDDVDEAVRSGALLRGEVLARWHDVVGTGDLMRALESRLGRLRDRVKSLVTGAPAADVELQAAVRSSVDAVVHAAADRAAERAAGAWRGRPAGRALLEGAARLDAASPALLDRTREEVRAWQGHVFELVSREAGSKRTTARLASLGVNGAGLVVMLAVFAQTGGLTGAEVAVAGGTSAVGQRLLEALLGDQAVRSLAARAREDLLARTRGLLDEEAARFDALLEPAAPPAGAAAALDEAVRTVERAR
jgi:energy-coupling factor transporter ATP-binding protein EcfA2